MANVPQIQRVRQRVREIPGQSAKIHLEPLHERVPEHTDVPWVHNT